MAAKVQYDQATINGIKLDAAGLDLGEKDDSLVCPFCKKLGSYGVRRVAEGLVYNCFRVACGAKGFVPMVGGFTYSAEAAIKRKTPKPTLNPYLGKTTSLPDSVVNWLYKTYELKQPDVAAQGWTYDERHHRIIMPINSYFGYSYGVVAKKLPLSPYKGAKALNYFDKEEPVKLAYSRTLKQWIGRQDSIVLVEDIISATKVGKYMNCAALLGTNLTHKQIAFLSAHYKEIVMMLDPDAIGKSLLYQKQYGSLFDAFKIVDLKADPKDSAHEILAHALLAV